MVPYMSKFMNIKEKRRILIYRKLNTKIHTFPILKPKHLQIKSTLTELIYNTNNNCLLVHLTTTLILLVFKNEHV